MARRKIRILNVQLGTFLFGTFCRIGTWSQCDILSKTSENLNLWVVYDKI